MSNKKLKISQNNENLCPTARKRTLSKTSPQKTWKLAKLESTSSPSALTLEDLEEMGIGMLDSEESSSSATSSIALVMSGSLDENSNEATPNQNAAKFFHHPQKYQHLDVSLDISSDNANHSLLDMSNDILKDSSDSKSSSISIQRSNSCHSNSNSNSNFEIYSDSEHLKEKEVYQLLPQYKKNLKGGVGNVVPNSSSSSSSSSPAGARLIRSPLKAVPTNQQDITSSPQTQPPLASITQQQQQQPLQKNQSTQVSSSTAFTPNATLQHVHHQQLQQQNQTQSHPQTQKQQKYAQSHSQYKNRTYSPSPSPSSSSLQPSTSLQAALLQQHTQQQQQIQQSQQLQKVQKHQNILRNQLSLAQHFRSTTANADSTFFLFRPTNPYLSRDRKDHFNSLSDEIILQIFKWLPKKALLRCGMVNRRFYQCARDESLWMRLDLGGRSLRSGAMEDVLTRGVVVLRLAQTQLAHPVFSPEFLENRSSFESKLQYLDLSMVAISKPSLKMLLSRCKQLKKLSLEHVPVNDEICNEIAKNVNLEALNLGMCSGLEAWSVRKMMESLKNLTSLNISWTNLSVDAVTSLVTNITPNILRLNIAGCRKTMFDSHLASLAKRCPQLLELDLSDCSGLTGNAITIICKFKMLEYLSLSRCYLIPAASYVELSNLSTLTYLDIFGMLSDNALDLFQNSFPNLGINKFVHSSVARPTVGSRRTSIWGLRTRD